MIESNLAGPIGRPLDRVNGFQGPGPFPRTLEGVKAKGGEGCRIGMAIDAKDTAFVPEFVEHRVP